MKEMKKKLLDELIKKLSEMDDPLMGLDEECEEPKDGASVKVVKVEAKPLDEKKKIKLMGA